MFLVYQIICGNDKALFENELNIDIIFIVQQEGLED